MAHLAVFGSLNWDHALRCTSLPKPGETILSQNYAGGAGGKGLNQAIAAARAGAEAALFGAVGTDALGEILRHFAIADRVVTVGVTTIPDESSGQAFVMVADDGENAIIVAAGANARAGWPKDAGDYAVKLAQLEVPIAAVADFFKRTPNEAPDSKSCLHILNAAPAILEAKALFEMVDILIVNEHELAYYLDGSMPMQDQQTLGAAARGLMQGSMQYVIVTLGAKGSLIVTHDTTLAIGAPTVKPVDTTGAGDCFCGYLAAGLAAQMPMAEAVAWASAAAAISVTRHGAAASIPFAHECDNMLG